MYKTLENKKIAAKNIKKIFKSKNLNILVDNQNINEEKNIFLRKTCKKLDIIVFLIKNSVAKIAFKKKLDNFFYGQNLLISIQKNETEMARYLVNKTFFPIKNIKKIYWNNKILNFKDIENLAKLTNKKEELKTFLKTLNIHLKNLYITILQPTNYFLHILKNLKKNQ